MTPDVDRRTAVSSSHLTPCWRGVDSNHQYRCYERVSRLLPNGDAGPKADGVVREGDCGVRLR